MTKSWFASLEKCAGQQSPLTEIKNLLVNSQVCESDEADAYARQIFESMRSGRSAEDAYEKTFNVFSDVQELMTSFRDEIVASQTTAVKDAASSLLESLKASIEDTKAKFAENFEAHSRDAKIHLDEVSSATESFISLQNESIKTQFQICLDGIKNRIEATSEEAVAKSSAIAEEIQSLTSTVASTAGTLQDAWSSTADKMASSAANRSHSLFLELVSSWDNKIQKNILSWSNKGEEAEQLRVALEDVVSSLANNVSNLGETLASIKELQVTTAVYTQWIASMSSNAQYLQILKEIVESLKDKVAKIEAACAKAVESANVRNGIKAVEVASDVAMAINDTIRVAREGQKEEVW